MNIIYSDGGTRGSRICMYDKQKEKHLEKLATKILKNDEKAEKLKSKHIKGNFLNNF